MKKSSRPTIRIPSWWFAMRPHSGYEFWIGFAKFLKTKRTRNTNRTKVQKLLKEYLYERPQ